MTRFVLSFILLTFSSFLLGQGKDLSDLYSVVEEKPDSVIELGREFIEESTDEGLKADYYHLVAMAFKAKGDYDSTAYYLIGEKIQFGRFFATLDQTVDNTYEYALTLYYRGLLTEADSTLQELLPSIPDVSDYRLKCNILLDAGWLARERGRHQEALDLYFEAKKIAELNLDNELLANAYSKIAVVYHVIKEFDTAKKYYDLALDLLKKEGISGKIARLYNNYGLLYMDQGMSSEAIPYFERSIEMCDSLGNIRGVAIANENLGLVCFEHLDNYTLALSRFKRSLDIWRSFDDLYGQAQTLVYMIYVYNAQGAYQQAIDSSYRSLYFCEASGARDVERDLYKEMSIAYEGLGNDNKAFGFYKKHISLRDSLQAANKLEEIKFMGIQNEMTTKAFKDSMNLAMIHQQESAEIEAKVESQKVWTYALLIGLAGLLVVSFLIFRGSQQRKKSAGVIAETNLLLKTKNDEIIDSITYAKRIQDAILPSPERISSLLKDSFIFYLPKDIVAGDFYWIEQIEIDNIKKTLFAVADCTGHGVPGAMVSVVCSNALNKAVKEMGLHEPGEILEAVTEIVTNTFENSSDMLMDGMDVCLISMVQNEDHIDIEYAGANNPLWVIRKGSDHVEEFKATKRPIGKYMVDIPFKTNQIKLNASDAIYMFTDGYADQFGGEKNKKFKYKTLKNLLLSMQDQSPLEQEKALLNAFEKWRGKLEQVDDICIVGITA